MSESQIRTFVFTDIIASTSLKRKMEGQDAEERNSRFAHEILGPHRALIETQLVSHEGRLVSTQGDGLFLEFRSPSRAVQWAVGVQNRHSSEPI
ncbi:MAG: hypothetical protein N2C12_03545, partial [Planctomycetales bacterium]